MTTTLGDVAAQAPGTAHESFHFLLNDTAVKDNRIPPYGMSYDEARTRNALPVPAGQFGSPGPGGTYQYFDQVALDPPAGPPTRRSSSSTSRPAGSTSSSSSARTPGRWCVSPRRARTC